MFAVTFSFKANTTQLSYQPAEDLLLVGAASTVASAASEDPAISYSGLIVPVVDSVKTSFIQLIPAGLVLTQLLHLIRKDQIIYVVITAQPAGCLVQLYFESVS